MFLKELTELNGGSGDEKKVRDFIEEKVKNRVEKLWIDRMGNLIAFKRGRKGDFKIIVAAHMDEVSFMITNINDDGTLSFAPVGGIDPRVVVGKKLRVGEEIGVVGYKPIHLQKEKKDKVTYDELVIDIGASKKDDVKIEIGTYAYFTTEYEEIGKRALGKAFDDRVGCSIMMKLIHESEPMFDTYFAFLVQEEVGLRGSSVVLEQIDADVVIVLEGTTAGDIEGNEKDRWATHLGDGPAITFMHSWYVIDKRVFETIVDVAKDSDIPFQYKMRTAGGTDAARFVRTGRGVPAGVISVPARYIHSPVSMIDLNDFENAYKLVRLLLETDVLSRRVGS